MMLRGGEHHDNCRRAAANMATPLRQRGSPLTAPCKQTLAPANADRLGVAAASSRFGPQQSSHAIASCVTTALSLTFSCHHRGIDCSVGLTLGQVRNP